MALINSDSDRSIEADLARAHQLDPVRGDPIPLLDARMQVFHIRGGRPVNQVVSALSSDGRVISAQPNFLYRHQGQSGAARPAGGQYSAEKLGLPSAHKLSQGRGVVVAVIDSAIDASHPDLRDAVIASYDAVGSLGRENDARGGAIAGVSDGAIDTHGTAIAGVIRARGYASGVAPGARLLSVRAFSTRGAGGGPEATSAALVRAIQWSVDNGANVLNMSFTGPQDAAVEKAIARALTRNVITVAAAGNGGPDAPAAYPAAYSNVIAVTAVDRRDRIYAQANRGHYIAIAAPGVDILAPADGGAYEFFTGTSFAAAEVSGVMALLLERRKLNPGAAREVVTRTAESLPFDVSEEEAGAGRINAYESLMALGAW
jgi:subtilisin family serine protease